MFPNSTTCITAAPTTITTYTAESMSTMTTVIMTDATTTAETVSTQMITAVTDASTTLSTTDTITVPPTTSPECDSTGCDLYFQCCMSFFIPVLPLVPDGVGLYLDGNQLANNSLVNLEDIGEGDCALICYTNSPSCCVLSRAGEWYFPNRSRVKIKGEMEDFYRSREGMMVCLNRRNNAMGPTGIYCCDIPGSNGDMCVGVYNLGDGKQILKVKQKLKCIFRI